MSPTLNNSELSNARLFLDTLRQRELRDEAALADAPADERELAELALAFTRQARERAEVALARITEPPDAARAALDAEHAELLEAQKSIRLRLLEIERQRAALDGSKPDLGAVVGDAWKVIRQEDDEAGRLRSLYVVLTRDDRHPDNARADAIALAVAQADRVGLGPVFNERQTYAAPEAIRAAMGAWYPAERAALAVAANPDFRAVILSRRARMEALLTRSLAAKGDAEARRTAEAVERRAKEIAEAAQARALDKAREQAAKELRA